MANTIKVPPKSIPSNAPWLPIMKVITMQKLRYALQKATFLLVFIIAFLLKSVGAKKHSAPEGVSIGTTNQVMGGA